MTLRNLRVDGREYDMPTAVDTSEGASDLNLGTSILFIITTDFAGGAVWLEPRNDS